jgi:GAF domain-containing protein
MNRTNDLTDSFKNPAGSKIQPSLIPQLYLLLSSAIEMLGADKGNIQFFEKRTNTLKLMVQIGFKDDYLRRFSSILPGDSPCGVAFKTKQRVIIEDVDNDPTFSHLSSMFRNHGYSAVQSTPMFDGRQVFGILSTHFLQPHHCDEHQLAMFDTYLKQAVPIILRRRKAMRYITPDESILPQRSFPFLQSI